MNNALIEKHIKVKLFYCLYLYLNIRYIDQYTYTNYQPNINIFIDLYYYLNIVAKYFAMSVL